MTGARFCRSSSRIKRVDQPPDIESVHAGAVDDGAGMLQARAATGERPARRRNIEGTPSMTKPRLYGISGSRAIRAIWGIEETGIAYEHIPVSYGADSKGADYLAVNPNGRIPALVDGDLQLFESMAINLYLAKRYGGALYPSSAKDEALTWQWSLWAISEIEPLQMQIVIQKIFTPEDKRNPKVVEQAARGLQRPLKVLNASLDGRDWLVGGAFSVADLNVASVMHLMRMIGFDYSEHANVQRWADACYARPAFARALARP
jgi:glutathione S-transferase